MVFDSMFPAALDEQDQSGSVLTIGEEKTPLHRLRWDKCLFRSVC